jgi:amino acid transporter
VSSVLARSILSLVPDAPWWLTPVMILVLVSTLVSINFRGVRTGARVIEAATVAKLLPLLAFVGIGVFFIEPSNLVWTAVPDMSAVLGTAGIVIFAFSGIEGSLVPSGEVKNPAKTVPRAAFMALGAATLLYLAIQFVALGILGLDLAGDRTTPLASAAGAIVGAYGPRCRRGHFDVRLFERQRSIGTAWVVRHESRWLPASRTHVGASALSHSA